MNLLSLNQFISCLHVVEGRQGLAQAEDSKVLSGGCGSGLLTSQTPPGVHPVGDPYAGMGGTLIQIC